MKNTQNFEAISEDGHILQIVSLQDVMFPPKPMKRSVINNKAIDHETHSPKKEVIMKGPIKYSKELEIPTSPSRKVGHTHSYVYVFIHR